MNDYTPNNIIGFRKKEPKSKAATITIHAIADATELSKRIAKYFDLVGKHIIATQVTRLQSWNVSPGMYRIDNGDVGPEAIIPLMREKHTGKLVPIKTIKQTES